MKADTHPKYFPNASISCAGCSTTYTVGSTKEKIQVELCSNCHPFYTGKQKLVDTAGRVDRFRARAAKAKASEAKAEPKAAQPAEPAKEAPATDTPETRLKEMKKSLESDEQ